ncbi:MAG: nucleotidyl transferase AbiEii/AbiGii toxin family protein [Limisphaerales bacterium]
MPSFAQLPPDQRRRLCNEAQAKLGLHAVSVEKDFWVCWTLRELFQLPEWGSHFTFKGGTSLAKGWKLIERFSEDIDVVIERDFLGFGGDRGPEHAPSKKQQRARLDALKAECQKRIRHSLQPALAARFKSVLPADAAWKLEEDPADPDGQSLSFFYPAVIETAAYVQPVVKIELGARSDRAVREAANSVISCGSVSANSRPGYISRPRSRAAPHILGKGHAPP